MTCPLIPQQIHEDKAAPAKSVTNNLGKFVKADNAFLKLDPSDLHLACETERKLGCPHVSFESPRIAVECLNSKLKEDYMQSRCMSLLKELKNKPALVLHSHDSGDKEEIALQEKRLITRIKSEAKSIKEKYVEVPYTTDFAIMYLPTESLYADILRFSEHSFFKFHFFIWRKFFPLGI